MTLPIILLGLGLLLIVLELMFPSLGALGIASALCIIGAIAVAFTRDQTMGIWFLVATALLVPAALMIGLKLLPRSPVGKLLVNPGYTFQDDGGVDVRDRTLVGKTGVAENFLRPAGTIRIDGRRVDVLTRGDPIEAGARVTVIDIEGNRVVVARIRDDVDPPHATT